MHELSLNFRSSESSISIVLRVFFVDVPNSVKVQILSASAFTVFFCGFEDDLSEPLTAVTVKKETVPAGSVTFAESLSVWSRATSLPLSSV